MLTEVNSSRLLKQSMKYIIWYDASNVKYCYGSESAFKKALANSSDDAILAEEFTNTSIKLVEKIVNKLNQNLVIVK